MADECKNIGQKLRSAFDLVLQEELDDGSPGEVRKSEFDFVRDFEYVENIMGDAIGEIGKDQIHHCGLSLDDAYEIMEGHWQRRMAKGDFDELPKEVEEL